MSDTPETIPIEELLEHRRWLAALAANLVGGARAEDLVQDTFVAALESPPRERRGLRGWLATVLRNRARDEWRREKTEARALERSGRGGESADDVVAAVERGRELARAVLALAEPYRTTVLLRYYRGLSAAAIARRTDVPAGTVRSRLKRGLDRLRDDLEARHGGHRPLVLFLLPLANRTGWKGALAMSTTTKIAVTIALALAAGTVAFSSLLAAPPPAVPAAAVADADPMAVAAAPAPAPAPAAPAPDGPAPAPEEEKPEDPYEARLDTALDFDFADCPVVEAIASLASRAGLHVTYADPSVEEDLRNAVLTFQVQGLSFRNGLSLVLAFAGPDYRWRLAEHGVVEIRRESKPAASPPPPAKPPVGPPPATFEVHRAEAGGAVPLADLPAGRAVVSITAEGHRYLRGPGDVRTRPVSSDYGLWLALHDLADAAGREAGADSSSFLPVLVDADADAPYEETLIALAIPRSPGVRAGSSWLGAALPGEVPGALPASEPEGPVPAPAPGASVPWIRMGSSSDSADLDAFGRSLAAAGDGPILVHATLGGRTAALVRVLDVARRHGLVVALRSNVPRRPRVTVATTGEGFRVSGAPHGPASAGTGEVSATGRPSGLLFGHADLFPPRVLLGARTHHRNFRTEGGSSASWRAHDALLERLEAGEPTGLSVLARVAAGELREPDLAWLATREGSPGPFEARAIVEAATLSDDPVRVAAAGRLTTRWMEEWNPEETDAALRTAAALLAGVAPDLLPSAAFRRRVGEWLDRRTDPTTGRAVGDDGSLRRTATAAWIRIWLGEDPDVGTLARSLDACLDALPGGPEDREFRHFAALALFQAGGDRWKKANAILRPIAEGPLPMEAGGEADAFRALLAAVYCRYPRVTR